MLFKTEIIIMGCTIWVESENGNDVRHAECDAKHVERIIEDQMRMNNPSLTWQKLKSSDDERIGMKNPIGLGDDIKKWSKMINPTEVLHDET